MSYNTKTKQTLAEEVCKMKPCTVVTEVAEAHGVAAQTIGEMFEKIDSLNDKNAAAKAENEIMRASRSSQGNWIQSTMMANYRERMTRSDKSSFGQIPG